MPYACFNNEEDLRIADAESEKEYLACRKKNAPRLPALTLTEIEDLKIEEPEPLIDPILKRGESMIISARAGVGKTFLGMTMGKALSDGEALFDRWPVSKPRKVLYVDGEMGINALKKRAQQLEIFSPYFRMIPCDWPRDRNALNLYQLDDQFTIEKAIEEFKPDVVFLDNLSTLYKVDATNQAESWIEMQNFILRTRSSGPAVVLIDHNGKVEGNGPRGTSAKSDIMNTIIDLRKPNDYNEDQGARFILNFTKHRSFCGEQAKALEVWLKNDQWEVSILSGDNQQTKETQKKPKKPDFRQMAYAMFNDGMNVLEALDCWPRKYKEKCPCERSMFNYHAQWQKEREDFLREEIY